MKSTAILVISVLVIAALCSALSAAQFPDVPANHWAYAVLDDLADKGMLIGYPSGMFDGKRKLTRHEFAEAISRIAPVLQNMAQGKTGPVGPVGPQGPQGPAGPEGITPEELAAIRNLVDEFRDELGAQGVDIQSMKKDAETSAKLVSSVEADQQRVKISAEVPLIGRAGIASSDTPAFDRDSRRIGVNGSNLARNNAVYNDFQLGLKGRISSSASVNALIAAGNYLPFALSSNPFQTAGNDEFNLFNLYVNTSIGLGPLGGAQARVGRFPFQLTPLTLKFVAPDSYAYVSKLQNGDYAFDGGSLTFKLMNANITAFAADSVSTLGIEQPYLQVGGGIPIGQLAGARAVLGAASSANLGLTYYQVGPTDGIGQMQVYGADVKTGISKLGFGGEYAKSQANDFMKSSGGVPNTDNNAWNANLSYQAGRLGLGGGYGEVQSNYSAPGYWSRLGRAVNLQNVKGTTANLSYALNSKLILTADGQFLQPRDGSVVSARSAIQQSDVFNAINVDKVTGLKAGVKYALTPKNAVDIGWEEVLWEPVSGNDTKEFYYTIGLGHSFNSNAQLKLLYQIVDYKQGDVNVYGDASYRGGVATAEFQLKY